MRQITVGDTIIYQPWRGERRTASVEQIEVCQQGEKYGRAVNSCNIDICSGTLILCGYHWCYFDQVKHIIKK